MNGRKQKASEASGFKASCLEKMFVQRGEKRPRLRLAGFKGDWIEKRIGDITTVTHGVGYTKSDLKDEGAQIILYGRLYTAHKIIIDTVDTFADRLPNAVSSKGGEVIVPSSGETAEDIAIASVVRTPGIIISGGLNIIQPTEQFDSIFLALNISYGVPHYAMSKLAQGKSVVHLYARDIEDTKILVPPTVAEQEAIGKFFEDLDNAVELQAKKVEKLHHIKAGCLERMFG